MPPDVRSSPAESPLQLSRLTEAESLARTNDVAVIVADDAQDRQGSGRRRNAPRMFVSLFEPKGRRTWWWFTGRCVRCGSTAFGRVRYEEDAVGIRRASCGHRVYLTVARVYRLPGPGAAA
jgi:hypothetical protein